MTRQEAVEHLTGKLTEIIDEAMSEDQTIRTEEAMVAMGYVGDDLYRLMSKAAMAAWEASANVQDWMKAEGHLKESE